jgi:hypothetical protein
VRAAACLDGENTLSGKSTILYEEFLVFASENIIGYCSYVEWWSLAAVGLRQELRGMHTNVVLSSKEATKGESQGRLSRANRAEVRVSLSKSCTHPNSIHYSVPSNSNRKPPLLEIP